MTGPARFALIVLLATAAVFVILWVGARALRTAKRSSTGVGAVGWALLFLTSGRMPPPPPASQIEVDIAGKKAREASRDSGADQP
jgi:hypothetical protein